MPVEITILSGSRQGERLTLEADAFCAGAEPDDALAFVPAADPGIVGHRAELRRSGDGWRLRNLGTAPVWVNQSRVTDQTQLRSGDIVRMSEAGPDFSFVVTPRGNAASPAASDHGEAVPYAAAAQRSGPPPRSAPGGAASSAASGTAVDAAPDEATPPMLPAGEALPWYRRPTHLAGLGLLAVVLLTLVIALSSGERSTPVTLPEVAPATVTAGEQLRLTLQAPEQAGRLRYQLHGELPEGVELDETAGVFLWRPSLEQPPGAYEFTLSATPAGADEPAATRRFTVQLRGNNRPPRLAPIANQEIDVRQNLPFKLLVEAVDPDQPAAELRFRLAGEVPPGLAINERSGLIVWKPPAELVGSQFDLAVEVEEQNPARLSSRESFRLSVVRSDPWEAAAARIRESCYLLVAQQPDTDQAFPLGTVGAVGQRELLTSGLLASELAKQMNDGLQLTAVHLASGTEVQVVAVQLPKYYEQLAGDAQEQMYFDLALLTIDQDTKRVFPLAEPAAIDKLDARSALRCVVFPVQGDWLNRLAHGTPELLPVEVQQVTRLPLGLDDPPRLLQLQMASDLPAFGCPIVNEQGELVALYSRAVAEPAGEHWAVWTGTAEVLLDRTSGFWTRATAR